MAVRRVVWLCRRPTIDRAPREELKIAEICIPPAEIVMFAEALEDEMALMDMLDAIMREMVRK